MMSWLPLYNSWAVMVGVVSIFFWKLWGVLLFLGVMVVSLYFLIREVLVSEVPRYGLAFLLFIVTEFIVFGSLFVVLTWYDDGGEGSLSDSLELPFLGCFLLLTSSLSATLYHHAIYSPFAWVYLVISAILGFLFVCVQLWEFFDCECDILYCTYLGVSFSIVGLHFTHVFVGVVAMIILLIWGASKSFFYGGIVVWYWHFVDYIWLWVYLIVYYA